MAIPETIKRGNTPLKIMMVLIMLIMIFESLIMFFLGMINGMVSPVALILLDSLLLVCILCPVLYLWVILPLLTQISERDAAECALLFNKVRYRQLIDTVDGIVWEADPRTFAFEFVSHRAEDILGFPVQRWYNEPTFWADHIHPEDREWAVDFCLSSTREKRDHTFEYRMMTSDGRIIWIRDIVTVITDGDELKSLRGLMVDVTERKNAEIALAASEKRHLFLADNLYDVIWEIDEQLCYSYISGAVGKSFGYKPDELLGQPFGSVLTEQSLSKAHHIISAFRAGTTAVISAQVKVNHEFEFRRKDGSTFWGEVSATLIFSPEHELIAIIGSTRDISERKHAEAELMTAHDLLQKTINSLSEAVIIVDSAAGEIKDCNLATEKIFAYSREELLGADISLLHVSSDQYRRFCDDMLKSFDGDGSFSTKSRMKRKSGWVFSCEQSVSPISMGNGNRQHYVFVVRDVSVQIMHEEQLHQAYNMVAERNSFVESVITSIQSGIIVLDPELRIRMINPYAANICGSDMDELLDLSLKDLCPELYEQVLQGGGPDEMIATFNGNRLIIGFSFFRIRNVRGSITGTIVTFKDLTEVVRIRNEIRQKQRLSAMGEVVARVAHEMRNPLFGMTAAGQILNMELDLNSAQQVLMDSFLKESRRLNNLVDELLDSTREVRLSKKKMDLVSVVNDSLRLVKEDAAEREVTIAPAEITGEIIIHGDPDKLEQVLLNLLRNGIEACTTGGRVDLAVKVDGISVLVEVVDNGSGIPDEIMESIFDVFYTTKKNGTGMGLSISKNIVEAHDGELIAVNNQNSGATFAMKLPLFVRTDESSHS